MDPKDSKKSRTTRKFILSHKNPHNFHHKISCRRSIWLICSSYMFTLKNIWWWLFALFYTRWKYCGTQS